MAGYDTLADVVCVAFRARGYGDLVQRPRSEIVAFVYKIMGDDCPAHIRVGIADRIESWKDYVDVTC